MRGLREEYNGFWIRWLDLLTPALQLQLIVPAHTIKDWDSLRSFLDYECLLFYCDWLGSDLRIGHFFSFRCPLVNTPQLNPQLLNSLITDPEWIHKWTLFYNSEWTEERPLPRTVRPLLFVFRPLLRNVPSDLLPSNGGPPAVDYVTLGTCLQKRCLPMVIVVTI
jgi:hypothetical protein